MTEDIRQQFGRRQFLVRAGVLSAALAFLDVGALGASPSARAAALRRAGVTSLKPADLAPIFDELSSDTLSGLVAFVVPGPDAYSVAQGVSDTAPGGIAADGTAFMLNALDNFFPVPQEAVRLLVQALTTGLVDNLPGLPGLPVIPGLEELLDAALALLLASQENVPLSLVVALLLSFAATVIQPTALNGLFVSPFSRLTFAEKTSVFELLETDASNVAAMIDGSLTEPVKGSISGLIEFLGGALIEFAAFGSYSEYGVFDATTRTITSIPVGWTNSQYLALAPNNMPVEGWDEFKGYLDGES
jgi:hypothetical protein